MTSYRTIPRPAWYETEVRRSRFRCDLARVESETDARDVIAAVRAAHHDARHHCTAFVIGPDSALLRSNDDGEPSGTAGAPMLEVLTRRGITDVVAVVSRWFGGTLLGAGGLVRAYGEVVGLALDGAGVQERVLREVVTVTTDPPDAGAVDHRLRALGDVTDVAYGARTVFTVTVDDAERLGAELASMTSGRAGVELAGTAWVDA